MKTMTLAYLAGAMDADGCFSIRKSTQRKRMKGDCQSVTYFPRILFGQIQPTVCELLKETFGGMVCLQKPGTPNSRTLYKYQASAKQAADACRSLLPFLRLKADRASVLIELDEWRSNLDARRPTFWWLKENPGWAKGPMLTAAEVAARLSYSHPTCVTQAIGNGLLVALPLKRNRWAGQPARFPAGLVDFLESLKGRRDGRYVRYSLPPQYLARCDELYEKIRSMNSLGVNGTCVTHRTGYHTPVG